MPTDNKYSFNESLAYAYWMTGDDDLPARRSRPPRTRTTAARTPGPPRSASGPNACAAFKLTAHAIDYEVTGNVRRAATA
jgi:hypothetical protein